MTSWYDDYLASMAVVNARPTPAVGACLTLRPTTFITWHKTGTMLTEMLRKILLEHVNASCAGGTLNGHLIATTGFHPKAIHNGTRDTIEGSWIDVARRRGHNGRHRNSIQLHLARVRRQLPTAWRGWVGSGITITYKHLVAEHSRALVYVLREPFSLVVSFCKYHLSGKECDGHWQRPVCKEIKRKSAADGVRYVGGFVAKNQLPLMQYVHEKLGGHASHSAHPRALGLRLEDWNHDFDKTALGLVRFLRKDPKDDDLIRVTQLATELRGADMNRMQERPSHAASEASAAQDATLRRYLETAKPLCQQLLEYSRALGYSSDVKCPK